MAPDLDDFEGSDLPIDDVSDDELPGGLQGQQAPSKLQRLGQRRSVEPYSHVPNHRVFESPSAVRRGRRSTCTWCWSALRNRKESNEAPEVLPVEVTPRCKVDLDGLRRRGGGALCAETEGREGTDS